MNGLIPSLFIFMALFTRIERFCHHETEGFQLYKIFPPQTAYNHKGNTRPDIDKLLESPFSYLGSGGQAYAFLSKDNQYVLKVFKQHHLDHEKRSLLHTSLTLASQELQEETGLIYLHLYGKGDLLSRSITLIDKIGCAHTLDPNRLTFALQKKAEPIYSALDRMIEMGQMTQAKLCIDSLVELISVRCKKGIADTDFRISRNCGVVEGKAVVIDIGLFSHDETLKHPENEKQRMEKELKQLERWIVKNHPLVRGYFDALD